MRKYYFIAELLIFKHRRQNVFPIHDCLLQSLFRKWRVVRTRSTFSQIGDGVGCFDQSGSYGLVLHWWRYKGERPVLSRCLASSTASASHSPSVWRLLYFSTGQRSCPQGAWDRAAVNLWNTIRLHRSSSVASQQSWSERSRLIPDVGEASQPDAWRWPAEVTPDRKMGTFPPGVHRWRYKAVASTSSSFHSSTRRTFWTQTLVTFDIRTEVHFDSHMSERLPIVDTIVLEWPH